MSLTDSVKFVRILKISTPGVQMFLGNFLLSLHQRKTYSSHHAKTTQHLQRLRSYLRKSSLSVAPTGTQLCASNVALQLFSNANQLAIQRLHQQRALAVPLAAEKTSARDDGIYIFMLAASAGVIGREGLAHIQRKLLVEALATLFYCTLRSVLAFLRRS